jgi:hypothetical protein
VDRWSGYSYSNVARPLFWETGVTDRRQINRIFTVLYDMYYFVCTLHLIYKFYFFFVKNAFYQVYCATH